MVAALSATAFVLTGCAPAGSASSGAEGDSVIKIGYISPVTGAYAGFSDGDAYMLGVVREQFADGIDIDGTNYSVEILDRDSGSDPAKAGELAQQLITTDKVDLLLATSTPETVNPVIAQCEANATPCLTTLAPWQAVVFGGGFSADKPMAWSHHYFFGIEGFAGVEPSAWDQVETNKKVGVLWPNDADGGAFRDPATGYTPFAEEAGYTIVDPGAYENGNQDFTAIISKFKAEGVEVITGVPTPPDFVTFWTQAAQQGFKPKVATIGKALFFPATVPSIPNDLGDGLAFTTWWGPTFPYESSFDGTTPEQWISNFEASPDGADLTWNQATPENESLFEVASAALQASGNPQDKAAVNKAFDTINMMTLAGTVDFTTGPLQGVATIPTAVGQWQKTSAGEWEWVVIENSKIPNLPVERSIEPLN
ncbi:ABC transporter substrate-binding protein [Cryobacterium frigoriphilum]|uniref:ABC transporter substrate-binding protein n=1 Tax=Cryobacterium frigoriphilum TaxID=1259150 RepID=UPI00141B81C2|nr:ABC transporter substrate-binding protein [Cryobacterium frigoriphilum]